MQILKRKITELSQAKMPSQGGTGISHQPRASSDFLFGTVLRAHHQDVAAMTEHIPIMMRSTRGPPIPASFDGRQVWRSYLAPIWDQGNCGGCYAYAITSVLQDKYALYTNNAVRPTFNPMASLTCHISDLTERGQLKWFADAGTRETQDQETKNSACLGGTIYEMARVYYRLGAVEDDCVSQKRMQTLVEKTGELPLCQTLAGPMHNMCQESVPPSLPRRAQRVWPVLDFYLVSESENLNTLAEGIKHDLYTHGPLVVGFNLYWDFVNEYKGIGVYVPRPNQEILGGHAVKVLGWGTVQQKKQTIRYWLCANSWGSTWGDKGYFKMEMANPLLDIERNHISIVPQVPGIKHDLQTTPGVSSVRALDRKLRENIQVDPFTLYPKYTASMIRQGALAGSDPVFRNIAYRPAPGTFSAQDTGSPRRLVGPTATALILTSGILLAVVLLYVGARRSRMNKTRFF